MDETLKNAEPVSLWGHFDEIRKLPHPSEHEGPVADWVCRLAEQHGASWVRDSATPVGNVVIRVPATPGHEGAPIVILQGHLDMVGEKDNAVEHDFLKDPIKLRKEGDLLYACNTTLGADNAIGLAAALACLTDPDVVHGPLELLFTVEEETGLTGARSLDASLLQGKILLNLDSEEHGALYIGCAGGADTVATLAVDPRPLAGDGWTPLKVVVGGLRGGHSGIDIPFGRANALLLLAAALQRALQLGIDLQLASFAGGSKHNAIPREAEALLFTREPERLAEVLRREAIAAFVRYVGSEIVEAIRIEAQPAQVAPQVWNPLVRDRFLALLASLPHGVIRMSEAVPGLVETSNNVAVAVFGEGAVKLTLSSRSSVNEELRRVQQGIVLLLQAAGCEVHADEGYPGWQPDLQSPILHRLDRIYTELFGSAPARKAIHAGLECGLLGAKVPGMDMISFGPDIFSPHSPTEHVSIPSVALFWKLLKAVLADLAKNP